MVLRGRPRGRLRGTTAPVTTSSPPQTPQGSQRSRAATRQAWRRGQSRQTAFAASTSSGDSAKNRSGSTSQQGSASRSRSIRAMVKGSNTGVTSDLQSGIGHGIFGQVRSRKDHSSADRSGEDRQTWTGRAQRRQRPRSRPGSAASRSALCGSSGQQQTSGRTRDIERVHRPCLDTGLRSRCSARGVR